LEAYYNTYKDRYESGVYFEDVLVSLGSGTGYEQGVTVLINLDDEYIARYNHEGGWGGILISPVDIQVTSGPIENGDVSKPEYYSGLFMQNVTAIIANSTSAIALDFEICLI